jgi:succinate dehydrogenase / fumarate reductase cytochrome b subunit
MAAKSGLLKSSIGMKFTMALSALFLIIFLLQHLTINMTSVFSKEAFNELSHFMGYNPVVQGVLQPILIFGVIYHFVMGFILTLKNNKARSVKYVQYKGSANASWASRNMILTGIVILLFLGLHFYDFWIHEINFKYIAQGEMDSSRYYEELVAKFDDPIRVGIYILSFVFLALHLAHGFESAFQSIGARHPKYVSAIKKVSNAYAFLVPAGFIFIAIYHYINSL